MKTNRTDQTKIVEVYASTENDALPFSSSYRRYSQFSSGFYANLVMFYKLNVNVLRYAKHAHAVR